MTRRAHSSRVRSSTAELRRRLEEAEQALEAIRTGQVESLVVEGLEGPRIYSLEGATHAYRVLLEAMGEGAATLGLDGTILYCNARLARMIGAPLERVMGSRLGEWVLPEDRPRLEAVLREAAGSEGRTELRLCAAGEGELPVLLSVSGIVDEGRAVLCALATDLSEQKDHARLAAALAEKEEALGALRLADENKSHFLAMLSHELRNPLVPIRNSVYILERAPAGSDQAARARAVIERQTKHMVRLIEDLLDVTRIAHGKVQLQLEPLDLREVVLCTVEDHRPIFEAAGVALGLELPEEALAMRGDRTRLSQVLGNLLHNAVKFTPRGGRAWVQLRRETWSAALLRVGDDGVGIAPHVLPRLFEPFAQGDMSLDRGRGGLGLGLSLVRALAELHGGEVAVRSQGQGQGAEFEVRLPLQPAAEAAPGASRA